MSRIVFFCIPAHGHTNPTLPVVKALTDLGHEVFYYSFEPFRAAIEAAGARFMGCDGYDLGDLNMSNAQVVGDIRCATELIVRTTLAMDAPVTRQLRELKPDVIVADSVAYWGKLLALKLKIPFVCSTTTFAFNRYSSRVMKQSAGDLIRLLIRLPRTKRQLKPLRALGYPAENLLAIVQNDDATDTVVYTSKAFQPCAETFPARYTFVGPCLRAPKAPFEKGGRPLVYVSMGTVVNRDAAFYRSCAEAFSDGACDVIMSLGDTDPSALGALPQNVRALPSVDQIAVLAAADAFVTHCGMNSASEALYHAVPLVMRPLTTEEGGVANRVEALGAGVMLEGTDARSIRRSVDRVLADARYRRAAAAIADSFRACGGAAAAAEAILKAARRS